ncbi:protein of unknown function [Cupriavidus taiwanensis]|uniref:Uncharacterized protein n=1 Tax=Cupriavidus taiwanensis TaxID=164546 RepID=A0A375IBY3_9BURK|nr:hypothetical protein CT19425_U440005 [Cupriavidus taiwanensis]SPK72286.1 protein of unknown function [Cupriavidus taiwanensis]
MNLAISGHYNLAATCVFRIMYLMLNKMQPASQRLPASPTLLLQNASAQSHSFRAPAHIGSLPATLS